MTVSRQPLLIVAAPVLAAGLTLVLHGGWAYRQAYLLDSRLGFVNLVPEWTWITTTLLLGLGIGTAVYLHPERRDGRVLKAARASAVVIGLAVATFGVEHLVHTTRVALDHEGVLASEQMSVLLRYGATVALQVVLAVGLMILVVISTHRELRKRKRAT